MTPEQKARRAELRLQLSNLLAELSLMQEPDSEIEETTGSKSESKSGWYLASILLRHEWHDEDSEDLERRCRAWENTYLIKAPNAVEAYSKALELGRGEEEVGEFFETDNPERKGHLRFEGLTRLNPIDGEMEDGVEILWRDYVNRKVKTVRSWVVPKEELRVFQASEFDTDCLSRKPP